MKKTVITTLSLSVLAIAQSSAVIIWNAGRIDNAQQWNGTGGGTGPGGGGEDVRFIQEAGGVTALPGSATNTGGVGPGRDIDDDYYFAGDYTNNVVGGYTPLTIVPSNEENMERAFTHTNATGAGDRNLRFHFNFPATVTTFDLVSINWGITGMEDIAGADGWDVEVKLNGVSLATHFVSNTANQDFSTPTTTLGAIGGTAGAGWDNFVELTGTSRNPTDGGTTPGGSRWLSIDYVEMDVTPIPEPSSLGFVLVAAGSLIMLRRRK